MVFEFEIAALELGIAALAPPKFSTIFVLEGALLKTNGSIAVGAGAATIIAGLEALIDAEFPDSFRGASCGGAGPDDDGIEIVLLGCSDCGSAYETTNFSCGSLYFCWVAPELLVTIRFEF